MEMLFDSHAHLDDEAFDEDRDSLIKDIFDSGVAFIVNPGADMASSKAAVELSEKYERMYAAVGIHPHDSKDFSDEVLREIEELAAHGKVVAIGEIGLDYYYDFSKKEEQIPAFRKQLRLARKLNMPVIIHDRDAHKDVFEILCEENAFDTGVVMHCFSGSAEMAAEYIKKGAYISLAGPVTFKNGKKAKEVAKEVPIDRLLIETDSPYLTPHPFRGKRNDSSKVRFVAEEIARVREESFDYIAKKTLQNARKFFRI